MWQFQQASGQADKKKYIGQINHHIPQNKYFKDDFQDRLQAQMQLHQRDEPMVYFEPEEQQPMNSQNSDLLEQQHRFCFNLSKQKQDEPRLNNNGQFMGQNLQNQLEKINGTIFQNQNSDSLFDAYQPPISSNKKTKKPKQTKNKKKAVKKKQLGEQAQPLQKQSSNYQKQSKNGLKAISAFIYKSLQQRRKSHIQLVYEFFKKIYPTENPKDHDKMGHTVLSGDFINIKRRIYDALNVMTTTGAVRMIMVPPQKMFERRMKGDPRNKKQIVRILKMNQYGDYLLQRSKSIRNQYVLRALIQRNQEKQKNKDQPPQNKKLSLNLLVMIQIHGDARPIFSREQTCFKKTLKMRFNPTPQSYQLFYQFDILRYLTSNNRETLSKSLKRQSQPTFRYHYEFSKLFYKLIRRHGQIWPHVFGNLGDNMVHKLHYVQPALQFVFVATHQQYECLNDPLLNNSQFKAFKRLIDAARIKNCYQHFSNIKYFLFSKHLYEIYQKSDKGYKSQPFNIYLQLKYRKLRKIEKQTRKKQPTFDQLMQTNKSALNSKAKEQYAQIFEEDNEQQQQQFGSSLLTIAKKHIQGIVYDVQSLIFDKSQLKTDRVRLDYQPDEIQIQYLVQQWQFTQKWSKNKNSTKKNKQRNIQNESNGQQKYNMQSNRINQNILIFEQNQSKQPIDNQAQVNIISQQHLNNEQNAQNTQNLQHGHYYQQQYQDIQEYQHNQLKQYFQINQHQISQHPIQIQSNTNKLQSILYQNPILIKTNNNKKHVNIATRRKQILKLMLNNTNNLQNKQNGRPIPTTTTIHTQNIIKEQQQNI